MALGRSVAAWDELRRLFGGPGTVAGLAEWQLLHRYAVGRDEDAFAALVVRHGPMVLGVCRRILGRSQDAEDAFQATFLVLARKAGSLGPCDDVGSWLYGVARRVALRVRSESARRRSRERPAGEAEGTTPAAVGGDPAPEPDLRPVLDEELGRLPASYRAAVVLCYLDGHTQEEAARRLGWPVGTVKGRLSRARELLRSRLTRRGLAPAVGIAVWLEREARAAVPEGLVQTTVEAAGRFAAGGKTAGAVSASVAFLVERTIASMILHQWKVAAVVLATTAAVVAGAGAIAGHEGRPGLRHDSAPVADTIKTPDVAARLASADQNGQPEATPGDRPAPDKPSAQPKTSPEPNGKAEAPDFPDGSPLRTARQGYQTALRAYMAGRGDAGVVQLWSRRLADQEADVTDAGSRIQAAEGHLKRMAQLKLLAVARQESGPKDPEGLEILNARYFQQDAQRSLDDLKRTASAAPSLSTPHAPSSPTEAALIPRETSLTFPDRIGAGGTGDGLGPGNDPQSRAILKKLNEPIAMNFVNETPLEDLLKYVKSATKSSEFPKGIPVYVNPIGLQEAEKTMTTPVTIDLDGVPLKRTLHLALSQIGLCYHVEDGMLYITAAESENVTLPPPMRTPSPFMVMQERAERGEMTPSERKAFIEMLKDLKEIKQLHGIAEPPNPGGRLQ